MDSAAENPVEPAESNAPVEQSGSIISSDDTLANPEASVSEQGAPEVAPEASQAPAPSVSLSDASTEVETVHTTTADAGDTAVQSVGEDVASVPVDNTDLLTESEAPQSAKTSDAPHAEASTGAPAPAHEAEPTLPASDPVETQDESSNTTQPAEPSDAITSYTDLHSTAQTEQLDTLPSTSESQEHAHPHPPTGHLPPETDSSAKPQEVPASKLEDYTVQGMRAITVEVDQGPNAPYKLVEVLMDYTYQDRKAYLGGFRNKRSGTVFHHACTQTPRISKTYTEEDRKRERETQTVKVETRSIQSKREASTQMERPGLLLDTAHDREIVAGRYQTADERDEIVEAAVRLIQRWTRGWMGRKRASYLWSKKLERDAFLREQEETQRKEAEEHRRREIERRIKPRTAADFRILTNELETWRLAETRKIKDAGLSPEKEHEALQQLLAKETKLLQTIDRLKLTANSENKELRIQSLLDQMAQPKQLELANGGKVDVHTQQTTRAKELQQLYKGLQLSVLTTDERLDVLLHVKWTVKEFDCNLTREIVQLIDREADLLNRGRNPALLEGLRKRISTLFLAFIENPEFNPEASRFQIKQQATEKFIYDQVTVGTARPDVKF